MALPLYLAMTAAEIQKNSSLPARMGYMACHFSPYGTGLSNLPKVLPENTMLILNDRTPIQGHDPDLISMQLESVITEFHCSCLLLDFQRPGSEETAQLIRRLVPLPCPVGVTDLYAGDLNGPVFLPPVPPDIPLSDYLAPWKGREIWLDITMEGLEICLAPEGYTAVPLLCPDFHHGFSDQKLHCHYHISCEYDCAKFSLFRTWQDCEDLLNEASSFGVTQAVGLWQELSGQAKSPA